MDRGSILHSEKGPGVTFAIFLTFRGGSIFNGEKLTGGSVHFQRVKMDRVSIFNGEKLTGGGCPFSTGENGPGVHFQRRKMDRGGGGGGGGGVHFTQGGVHFQPLKMDRGVPF